MALVRYPFLWSALAILWMILQDAYSLGSFLGGLAAGALVLLLFPNPEVRLIRFKVRGVGGLAPWLLKGAHLVVYFIWELLKSNWALALLVVRPKVKLTPGILAMPLRLSQPGQVALLANMITLTPGTITIDVAKDYHTLYIHCIDVSDPEAALAACYRFEDLILEVLD